jgi:hypothetical protein
MNYIPDKLQRKFFAYMQTNDCDSLDWTGCCLRNAEAFIAEHRLTNADPISCVSQYVRWLNNDRSGNYCDAGD